MKEMTLKELYDGIEGDYEQALKVLRMEKLLDKHIRKFPANTIFAELEKAGEAMNGEALFESAHAIKGVCANLGLVKLSSLASQIAEEFRPGNPRTLSDGEVAEKIRAIGELYQKAAEGIRLYEASAE